MSLMSAPAVMHSQAARSRMVASGPVSTMCQALACVPGQQVRPPGRDVSEFGERGFLGCAVGGPPAAYHQWRLCLDYQSADHR